MAIGERIRFFRNLRGMTQKYLGTVVGFPEKTADIRMAQYESGSRTPKADLTESLAGVLGVSPLALSVPDIDSYLGLMHTLFALEDRYGLTIEKGENGVSMRVDPRKGKDATELSKMLNAWAEQAEKYHNGEISREDYDKWRYNYPKYDENSGYVKVPSQAFSDAMVDVFKDRVNENE
ncbi:MAG: helix-turn-helix domain-containing protein [Ruminococcus bromii]|nr:helix-turn-helix domain-containing protein [Ruminococcus bromii]